jgi:NAD(P)-dependent dehydrogenase (short-subunit alcohol dehydrogenase family)
VPAIVTGASRGIGFAIADSLVQDGAAVRITARDPAELFAAAARLGGADRVLAVAGLRPGAPREQAERTSAPRTAVVAG